MSSDWPDFRLIVYSMPSHSSFWTRVVDLTLRDCRWDENGLLKDPSTFEGDFCVVVARRNELVPCAIPDDPRLLKYWNTQARQCENCTGTMLFQLKHMLLLTDTANQEKWLQLTLKGSDSKTRLGFVQLTANRE